MMSGDGKDFKYDIPFSGSKGNVARIEYKQGGFALIVDIGKGYKHVAPYLDNVHFLLISHRHSDHLVYATYKQIRKNHPYITIIGNSETNEALKSRKIKGLDVIIEDNTQFMLGDLKITSIQNYHGDVDCHGFIFESPDETLLYGTDLSLTNDYKEYLDSVDKKVDYLLLEANYDPQVIEFYETTKNHTGYDVFSNGSFRHLPTTAHSEMVSEYTSQHSIVEELHISETYHDFNGLIKKSKGKISQKDVDTWLGI